MNRLVGFIPRWALAGLATLLVLLVIALTQILWPTTTGGYCDAYDTLDLTTGAWITPPPGWIEGGGGGCWAPP